MDRHKAVCGVPERQEADVDRVQGRVRAGVECAVTTNGGLEKQDQVLPRERGDNFGAAVQLRTARLETLQEQTKPTAHSSKRFFFLISLTRRS